MPAARAVRVRRGRPAARQAVAASSVRHPTDTGSGDGVPAVQRALRRLRQIAPCGAACRCAGAPRIAVSRTVGSRASGHGWRRLGGAHANVRRVQSSRGYGGGRGAHERDCLKAYACLENSRQLTCRLGRPRGCSSNRRRSPPYFEGGAAQVQGTEQGATVQGLGRHGGSQPEAWSVRRGG